MPVTITKKTFKKLLKETLKDEPGILKEILLSYPIEVATKDDIKLLIEMMDKRFEALQREMDKRFEALQREMNARFEAVDKRFEALQREMNARFEGVDKRFEAMDKRFSMLTWFMGAGFSLLALLIALLKLFG